MTATGIKSSRLKEIPVPIPPLAEQHRIVAKVDQLMALCDQLKARLGEARQVHGNLANALIGQALNNEKKSRAQAVDFSAYLISKLASQRTFGRVAHMKLLFLADSHLGLGLMDGYRRHAAGPLDTTIYRVEERAAQEGLYSTSIEAPNRGRKRSPITSGRTSVALSKQRLPHLALLRRSWIVLSRYLRGVRRTIWRLSQRYTRSGTTRLPGASSQ